MEPRTLTLRELNRTLLARQMLLERESIATPQAIEMLVGVQSQIPNPPYIGLWTRLNEFTRDDLTQLMEQKQVIRAAMMRSTLHLVTADDHQRFRHVLQPALDRAFKSFYGKRIKGLDIPKLIEIAKPFLEEAPRTKGELKNYLLEFEPDWDGDAMVYAIRNYLHLVQVPPGGTWGAGTRASYIPAETWIESDVEAGDLRSLLHRYLAAFGPASVMDFQFWTGMVKLKDAIEPLKSELVIYQDEAGTELLDLPDMPIYEENTPASIRFMPEYDNLIISHKDRRRIIADDDYKKVFLSAARVLSTILIDGFVAGIWKASKKKGLATLKITPFREISLQQQETLIDEGTRLLQFIEDDVEEYAVEFV